MNILFLPCMMTWFKVDKTQIFIIWSWWCQRKFSNILLKKDFYMKMPWSSICKLKNDTPVATLDD